MKNSSKTLQMPMNFGVSSITMFWMLWNNVITPIVLIPANYVFFPVKIAQKMCYKIHFEGDKQFQNTADGNEFWCFVHNNVLVALNQHYIYYCTCSSQLCIFSSENSPKIVLEYTFLRGKTVLKHYIWRCILMFRP